MSFFKTIAVVGIAIALLPADQENQMALKRTALSVGAEARSFCEARPNICISREDAWAGFKSKAGFAYSLGHELIWGQQPSYTSYTQQHDQIGSILSSELGDL